MTLFVPYRLALWLYAQVPTQAVCIRCRKPVVLRPNVFATNGVEGVCLNCSPKTGSDR